MVTERPQKVAGDNTRMHFRPGSLRFVALAIVVSLPLLGMSGVASAKAAKGCHKTHTCKSGGGSGSGGAPAPITVQIDPNPVVETSQSNVNAVIQVETNPAFAGDPVVISSSQLIGSCSFLYFNSAQAVPDGIAEGNIFYTQNSPITVTLDDDGNVSVEVNGYNCAPGSDVVEADLAVAPFDTALGTLTVSPPVVTNPGVFGYPKTSGTVTTGEVETGDTAASGDSDVYAVFYVETNPVYAEQSVEITDNQLVDSCIGGFDWFDSFTEITDSQATPETTLDDDGNAVFVFVGSSCAATTSQVIADVLAGTHQTYTTTFTVDPPQPTI
jgi:hypothetical protein